MFSAVEGGLESSKKYVNDWMNRVKKVVPEDRLLIFQVKDGWEPLCKFLDVPVPSEPFPRVNDTASMLRRIEKAYYGSIAIIVGCIAVGVGLLSYFIGAYLQ